MSRSYALLVDDQLIQLQPGAVVLGRSHGCELVIDDALVSRRHARLLVSNVGVLVEDLGSTNGVYVNETRIDAPTALGEGDRLLIGSIELVLRTGHRVSSGSPSSEPPSARERLPSEPPPSASPTERADAFDTMGRLADRMLSLGRTEVAVKLVSGHLETLLRAARDGQSVPARMRDAATHHALRLAQATGEARWANLAIELHLLAKSPMQNDAITELGRLLPVLPGVDGALLFHYQQVLESAFERLGTAERDRALRIIALESS